MSDPVFGALNSIVSFTPQQPREETVVTLIFVDEELRHVENKELAYRLHSL